VTFGSIGPLTAAELHKRNSRANAELRWNGPNPISAWLRQHRQYTLHEMFAPVRLSAVTGPADVIMMCSPWNIAVLSPSVFSSGCSSCHIFFLSICSN
jgi:hypothetical protein